MSKKKLKKIALVTIEDLVIKFLYYDRKEDEELGVEDLDKLIKSGTLTEEEIVAAFAKALKEGLCDE